MASQLSMGWAQAPSGATVTEADIERAHRSQPAITDRDIERARRTHRQPTDAEVARAQREAGPSIDALPRPTANSGRQPLDLGALAEAFAAQTGGQPYASSPQAGPRLLVFISLSMPEATLQRLIRQAAQAQATLLVRGLVNDSLRDTVGRMQALIGTQRVAAQIDPQAFERHAVTRVPSFALAREPSITTTCQSAGCLPAADYALVAGDVSLDYALTHMAQTAPNFSRDARFFLQRLKR